MLTRLPWDRYLELIEADSRRLSELARRDLAAPVPTCPGWDVRQLVEHTAEVFQHKIACTRLGRSPENWPPPVPPGDPVDWLDASLDELLELLRERGPDAHSATWYPPDQTVGFWYRRMAHEAAIHRLDAEIVFDQTTPIDTELATDGIDEVLELFLEGDWTDQPADEWMGVSPDAGADQPVAVIAGTNTWRVTLYPDRVDVADGPGEVEATVGGDPSAVDRWLWGRASDDDIRIDGAAAVRALRDRLVLATQ